MMKIFSHRRKQMRQDDTTVLVAEENGINPHAVYAVDSAELKKMRQRDDIYTIVGYYGGMLYVKKQSYHTRRDI